VLTLDPSDNQVKLAVSRKLCGAVIGQKGSTIREFMSDSGATIRVQVRCSDSAATAFETLDQLHAANCGQLTPERFCSILFGFVWVGMWACCNSRIVVKKMPPL